MKANEIRVGNLVQKDGQIFEADHITIIMAHNYEPIPLTPGILGKAGYGTKTFEAYAKHWFGDNYKELCKYVHQLQNVHFIATGKELNIKL